MDFSSLPSEQLERQGLAAKLSSPPPPRGLVGWSTVSPAATLTCRGWVSLVPPRGWRCPGSASGLLRTLPPAVLGT